MPRERVIPTSSERPFDLAELFFSTTDRKGIIRSGNDVFTRVSGYDEGELIGEPHNIIRHPDMPRAVFQLLWDYIETDRPIAAYVKNMAKDGSYYWVLATVVGVGDGYLSVRMKPSSELLGTVEQLYLELRGLERGIESRGGTPKDAIAASTKQLLVRLAQLGFDSYDEFMRVALAQEIRSRADGLARSVRHSTRRAGAPRHLQNVLSACNSLNVFLRSQFGSVRRFSDLEDILVGKSAFVLGLADDVRLFSLNAQVGAARLRGAGVSLGVIADIMRTRSHATAESIGQMSEETSALIALLPDLAFRIALATLQSEMAAQFVLELIDFDAGQQHGTSSNDTISSNIGALAGCLRDGLTPLVHTLDALQTHLDRISGYVVLLTQELQQLHALQVSGRIEAARLPDADEFRVLFDEIRSQIELAKQELDGFTIVDSVRELQARDLQAATVETDLEVIQRWAAAA